ncbi:MAG: antitoxin Xre/MbcA/ParS toxin-binding domain-containing protein [bacterium]
MGFAQLLGNEYQEPLDLIHKAREGIKKSAFNHLQQQMGVSQKELAEMLHLTPRTLQRLRDDEKLPVAVSGQLLEIARVFKMAGEVLEDHELARKWLRMPIPALNQELPIRLLDTPAGIRWVTTVLGRMEYGVYS